MIALFKKNELSTLTSAFKEFRLEHKFRKIYEKHSEFVSLQPIVFGNDFEITRTFDSAQINSKPVTLQKVSITQTLCALAKNDPNLIKLISNRPRLKVGFMMNGSEIGLRRNRTGDLGLRFRTTEK
jgi:hypothetical protein